MKELSKERIDKILHEENLKTEDQKVLLRAIYLRYMHLYETYYSDIDKLNDKKIEQLRKYHEETKSLLKYYYMDIPHDVTLCLIEYDKKYTDNLLGENWSSYLMESREKFRQSIKKNDINEEELKAEYTSLSLEAFYDVADDVFRDDFDTGSKTVEGITGFFRGLVFGETKKDKK